jgi:hypothetical protein
MSVHSTRDDWERGNFSGAEANELAERQTVKKCRSVGFQA